MATEFILPDIGEGIAEALIVEWMVNEGDNVKSDQMIVKVETDKAVADLPSPVSGKILKINFKKGDTVNVGAILCVIGGENEKASSVVSSRTQEIKKEVENKVEKKSTKVEGKVLATPAVRKAAMEKGIDLSSITGSGKDGQIVMSDLEGGSQKETVEIIAPVAPSGMTHQRKYDQFGYVEYMPIKGIRKVIAENMMKSLSSTAQVSATEDIDVTKLWDIRKREKEHFAIEGIKLTFLPFVVKALVKALAKHPKLNATVQADNIIIKKYYNIGIAVQTDAGLMVPVLKIVERKNIIDIAKEVEELALKCKTRTVDAMELKGSSFTITNYGSVGGLYATPVINPGDTAILGLGRIFDRVVMDDKGSIRNAKILPISLTFDHQVIDGAEATDFIMTLKGLLENPDSFMI